MPDRKREAVTKPLLTQLKELESRLDLILARMAQCKDR